MIFSAFNTLCAGAKAFYGIRSIHGRGQAQIHARRAIILALISYGWSQSRIAARMQLDRSTIAHHAAIGRAALRDPAQMEFTAAYYHLISLLPNAGGGVAA